MKQTIIKQKLEFNIVDFVERELQEHGRQCFSEIYSKIVKNPETSHKIIENECKILNKKKHDLTIEAINNNLQTYKNKMKNMQLEIIRDAPINKNKENDTADLINKFFLSMYLKDIKKNYEDVKNLHETYKQNVIKVNYNFTICFHMLKKIFDAYTEDKTITYYVTKQVVDYVLTIPQTEIKTQPTHIVPTNHLNNFKQLDNVTKKVIDYVPPKRKQLQCKHIVLPNNLKSFKYPTHNEKFKYFLNQIFFEDHEIIFIFKSESNAYKYNYIIAKESEDWEIKDMNLIHLAKSLNTFINEQQDVLPIVKQEQVDMSSKLGAKKSSKKIKKLERKFLNTSCVTHFYVVDK